MADATVHVLEATGLGFEWDLQSAGEATIASEGTPLPDRVIDSIRRNGVAIKGPITTPVGAGFRSVNVALRQALDLYANVRPPATCPASDALRGGRPRSSCARTRRTSTPASSTASARRGGDASRSSPAEALAADRALRLRLRAPQAAGRKVTAVHKANIMKLTDGLFLDGCRRSREDYPEIDFEDRIVDNMCMQLVQRPEQFDVLVLPNLYGDIVSDLCAGLVGGLGVAPAPTSATAARCSRPSTARRPKYAGQNKVNPTALILTA